jgi:hypothetical protein
MIAIRGIIQKGQVILEQPARFPDGTEVDIRPVLHKDTLGLHDDDWPTDPEGIARHLAAMEQTEPFDMTDEERADIAAWRQKIKQYTIANMDKGVEDLFP